MRLTHPHPCQTHRITNLRTILEDAQPTKADRYAVQITDPHITAAAYVLDVAALRGGAALLEAKLRANSPVTPVGFQKSRMGADLCVCQLL
ncbi:hypothetical protein [Actinacidiphila soli]|uniref:hypothetical protein n=1 Tax=Actinacidiphila soli TaxID=2487275 RepID=UPI000FCA9C3F|nr:hypothetical protein [Actinacidiphila soli]